MGEKPDNFTEIQNMIREIKAALLKSEAEMTEQEKEVVQATLFQADMLKAQVEDGHISEAEIDWAAVYGDEVL